MGKLEKFYNKEYSIKSIYVVKTALMTFVLGLIIYYLAGQTGAALSFVSGVLKPLILGLVFTYLLSPVVKKLEHRPFGGLKSEAARKIAAVVLTFVIVLMALGLILGIIAVTVTKSLSAFNPAGEAAGKHEYQPRKCRGLAGQDIQRCQIGCVDPAVCRDICSIFPS